MTDINWSMLQTANPGNAFMEGFQNARKIRREEQQQSALAAYATNPSDQSMNALLPFMQPNQAFDIVQQRQQTQAKRQQEQTDHLGKAVGQAVLDVMRRPEGERAATWDVYVDQFARTNPNAAQYRGKYSEQVGMAVLAEQGLMGEYQKQSAPPKTSLQQNYEFLNAVNPQYGQQYIQRQVSEPPMIANNGDGTFTVIPRSQGQPGAGAAMPGIIGGYGGGTFDMNGRQATPVQGGTAPPTGAVDYLRKNPALKDQFETKYGRGSASQYLGGPTSGASATFPGN